MFKYLKFLAIKMKFREINKQTLFKMFERVDWSTYEVIKINVMKNVLLFIKF